MIELEGSDVNDVPVCVGICRSVVVVVAVVIAVSLRLSNDTLEPMLFESMSPVVDELLDVVKKT